MRVSVVIVNWNSEDMLLGCLEHLHNQSVLPDAIYVIDNASSHPVTKKNIEKYPNVQFIQNSINIGFAAANNQVIELLEDVEWVVLLNPDAFPTSTWLENLLNATVINPQFDFYASRQLSASNPDYIDGCGDAYHVSGLHWRIGHTKHSQGYMESSCEVFGPCAAAALYRTRILREVGGFDESFFCYAEDVDLAFRLRLRGYRCLYVPDAVVHHVGSATTGKRSDFAVYHGHRNLVWVYFKNMPDVLFWTLLPYHLLLNIFTLGWFVVRGQGRVIFRAKWDAIKGIPKIWHKRYLIQSNRNVSVADIWRVLDKRFFPRRHR